MNDLCFNTGTGSGVHAFVDWTQRAFGLSEMPALPKRKFKRKVSPSASALPGQAITDAVVEQQERRRTLLGVMARFANEGEISKPTLQAAIAFLDGLPNSSALPKVASDGEGGVLMAWAVPGQARTLVTIADGMVHAVARAGTADATYFPDLPFDGTVPAEVLQIIPR